MVERVADLPDGVLGFRASGTISGAVAGWLAPGELRLFDADESAAAKAWVAQAL